MHYGRPPGSAEVISCASRQRLVRIQDTHPQKSPSWWCPFAAALHQNQSDEDANKLLETSACSQERSLKEDGNVSNGTFKRY